jgi:hypothetical protein
MSLRHDSAARRKPALTRPVDRAVLAAARGKLVPDLLSAPRGMQESRIISGRGCQRHGHTPHVRRCT